MSRNRYLAVLAALALVGAAFAAPALAKKGEHGGNGKSHPATTKMKVKLDDHSLASGEAATGTVTVQTRDGKKWAAFAGAALSVEVDGTECATAETDDAGHATVSCAAADGDHVMKVRYAGDDTHKKSQRAQGFSVGESDDDDDDEEEQTPDPAESPTPDPSPTI
jgi:hypothetical protein